ncbi:hypothetical protein VPH35_029909 [Triticum aestivum]
MASPSDAHSATSGGGAAAAKQDLGDIFNQLDLNDDNFDDVEIDEEDPEINESVRWLALARVHTEKKFSQSAFYKDMRAAWNPAQRIHKLPDGFCKQSIVAKLLKDSGEILDMRLDGNTWGDYVRVRVKHDVRRPLTKYVSIVHASKRQVYLVRYEKLARFCKVCGLTGHVFKECGLGIHDETKMKFGDWLYADGPNQARKDTKIPTTYNTARPSARHEEPHGSHVEKSTPQEKLDPSLEDTASSPVKKTSTRMELDKDPRKRLNMDAADGNSGLPPQHPGVLAITDGSGADQQEGTSPSSSTNSKRVKVDNGENIKEISAASREEDRRTQ